MLNWVSERIMLSVTVELNISSFILYGYKMILKL
nr:MAG: hypothetical protein J07AB56_11050 [Candidatus Nanosalinarum sp. J07AB56]